MLSDLLNILVDLYLEENSIPKLIILQSVGKVLEEGIKNSYILIHLPPFVEKFAEMFLAGNDELIKRDALSINYTICKALAVQNTFLVAKHCRKMLEEIINCYYSIRHDDIRELTFKFFHLILILKTVPEDSDTSAEDDDGSWSRLKLKMFNILDTEMKKLAQENDGKRRFSVSPFLVKFGACLYVDLVRSKFISRSGRGTEEQARKRSKFNETFQGIVEMVWISGQEFDLGWFCVLCEIIKNGDIELLPEDLEKVIELLVEIQGNLKVDTLMEYFSKCCRILLKKVENIPKCREAFLTISQRILRGSTIDGHAGDLVRLVINSGFIPLDQRVRIVSDFLGRKESKAEMEILIAAFNDSNTKELFFSKNPLNTLSGWINSSPEVVVRMQPNLLAQIIVVFVMNSAEIDGNCPGNEKKTKTDAKKYTEDIQDIQTDLEHKFLLKFVQKNSEKSDRFSRNDQISLIHLRQLMESLPELPANIPTEVAALYFTKRAEIFLQIHNIIRKFSLEDTEAFLDMLRSQVIKAVKEIEKCLTEKKRQLSRIHIPNVIERLKNLFREDSFGLTADCEVSGITKYVSEHFRNCYSHLQGSNEEAYRVILTNCLQCLVYLHNFHSIRADGAFQKISEDFPDSDTRTKCRIHLDVIRTISQQPYNDSLAEWACTEIQDLTRKFIRSQDITEDILTVIQDATIYFKSGHPDYLQNILELLTRLLGASLKQQYRPQMAKNLLNQIIHLFRNGMAEDHDTADTFIEVLKRFLKSPVYSIQLMVVRAFVEIFADGKNIDFEHFPKDDLTNFFSAQTPDSGDAASNRLSIIVQLFQGLFVNSLPARRFILFEFAQMISRKNVDDGESIFAIETVYRYSNQQMS